MPHAGAVDGVAGGEVVGAVQDHVGAFDHAEIFQPLVDRNDGDVGVERIQRRASGVHLDRAHRVAAVKDLALQVSEVDLVGVGEGEAPDAGSGEVERCRAAEAARADYQSMGGPQLLLSFDADLRQQDVPAVTEKLLVVQFGLACGFGVSVCATVGDCDFTGSPLSRAIACVSWKSSFEPSSVGFTSGVDDGLVRGEAAAPSFFSCAALSCAARPFSRWRCRSASRTRVRVSPGSSTMKSGVTPSAWIERPPGV